MLAGGCAMQRNGCGAGCLVVLVMPLVLLAAFALVTLLAPAYALWRVLWKRRLRRSE
jgi:hypothetical protein